MQTSLGAVHANCRIAILMPQVWLGGMERNAWALADVLAGCRAPDGRPIEVVLGLADSNSFDQTSYDWTALERAAQAFGGRITIRRLKWTQRSAWGFKALSGARSLAPDRVSAYTLPVDGVDDFLDCDAWVVCSGSFEGYIPPLRPTAVYAADHVHRYVPLPSLTPEQIRQNEETYLSWRRARCVFSTTPVTVEDTISFGGVEADKVLLTPTLVDPVAGHESPPPSPPGDYILWVTNTSRHKNHARALEALRIYWMELGGRLDVKICGSYTDLLKPGSPLLPGSTEPHPLTAGLERGGGWAHRVHILGHVEDQAFFDLVSGSAFCWHNVIVDNGTYVAFDAARAGRHVVSSDYPSMRYLAEKYGVDAAWFPADDARAAAHALIETERKVLADEPPRHRLRADDLVERTAAYQAVVDRLLAP